MDMKVNIGTYAFGGFGGPDGPTVQDKLKSAAAMGYTGIEFLAQDLSGNTVEDLKKWLDETGLECVSVHADLNLMSDIFPKMAALGGKMVICPSGLPNTKEEVKEYVAQLEEKGKEAAAYGLKVGYHNHTWEFVMDSGKSLYEWAVEYSDPKYLSFQLDCGWAMNAGAYPPSLIRRYPGRFISIHVKENNKVFGPGQPMPKMDRSTFDFKNPPEDFAKFMASMNSRQASQCAMGDPTSNIDWAEIKKALDEQGIGECAWTVERELTYTGTREDCLKADCDWLMANVQ